MTVTLTNACYKRLTAKLFSDPIRTPTPEPVVIPEQLKLPEPEPEPVSIDTCTAIYSFEAQESDELTISEGDTIDVLGNLNYYLLFNLMALMQSCVGCNTSHHIAILASVHYHITGRFTYLMVNGTLVQSLLTTTG